MAAESLKLYGSTSKTGDDRWSRAQYEWGVQLNNFDSLVFDTRKDVIDLGGRNLIIEGGEQISNIDANSVSGTLIGNDDVNDRFNIYGDSTVTIYGGKGEDIIEISDFGKSKPDGDLSVFIADFEVKDLIRMGWESGYEYKGQDLVFGIANTTTRTFDSKENRTAFKFKHGEDDTYALVTVAGNFEIDYVNYNGMRSDVLMKLSDGATTPITPTAPTTPTTPTTPVTSYIPKGTEIGSENSDQLIGTAEADEIEALGGNDFIIGSEGNDMIRGGTGRDVIQYTSLSSDEVTFSRANSVVTVESVKFGTDKLSDVERIQLEDRWYALDTSENAGDAAKIIVAAFGRDLLRDYFSVGLALADSGQNLEQLSAVILNSGLLPADNSEFLTTIWKNLLDRKPNPLEEAVYLGYLNDGLYSQGELLAIGANTSYAESYMLGFAKDFVGLPYNPGLA